MAASSRSSALSYVSEKPPASIHQSEHQKSQPPSPLQTGPNATFTSFNNEGYSQRYHHTTFAGDMSRVSWVWGAPANLTRHASKDEDSIQIQVVSEVDAVGQGKMLNPYSEFPPSKINIVEPELNVRDAAYSIRSWRISEMDEGSENDDEDKPTSFTARFPHTVSPRPPESIQDINNEYQHPSYSNTHFQDHVSIASSNTLSYVSDDHQPANPSMSHQSAHNVYPSIHHFQQSSSAAGQSPWGDDQHHNHSHHRETAEHYGNDSQSQQHVMRDAWGEILQPNGHEKRSSFHEHIPENEAGPSRLPPFIPPQSHERLSNHQYHLPPLNTEAPFIPQRLSRASSISMRSGYGKYREPVLPLTAAPGTRHSQPITPITSVTPITPNVPITPSSAKTGSRFKFPTKLLNRTPNAQKTKDAPNRPLKAKVAKDLPQLPQSRLLKKQSPSVKSRNTLIPQEQEIVDLHEVDDGSSWVVYSH
ncbi:hypothetical protein CVT24_000649 [Panaeolus cyanescens]|uniref:Uncharacterized protein n=1 Tax=Panaeolus cyanescens TaxID=181874 RepID=A0A409YT69_9AGAR|nr:hypothetical protein CVT24_000649 [Panaeolus cyanescens]